MLRTRMIRRRDGGRVHVRWISSRDRGNCFENPVYEEPATGEASTRTSRSGRLGIPWKRLREISVCARNRVVYVFPNVGFLL